jgi:hypothetical protein
MAVDGAIPTRTASRTALSATATTRFIRTVFREEGFIYYDRLEHNIHIRMNYKEVTHQPNGYAK